MAKYRKIYSQIWNDPDFLDYTAEGKLLFIYLCTNKAATESGIYPLSPKAVTNETGIPETTVRELLGGKIKNVFYDPERRCVFVKNLRHYNPGGNPALVAKSIATDFHNTPTFLWSEFLKAYPEFKDSLPISSSSVPGLPTVVQPLANPSIEIPIEVVIPLPLEDTERGMGETKTDPVVGQVFTVFEANFQKITPQVADQINDLFVESGPADVLKALNIAIEQNKRTLAYVKGVLHHNTNGRTNARAPPAWMKAGNIQAIGGK